MELSPLERFELERFGPRPSDPRLRAPSEREIMAREAVQGVTPQTPVNAPIGINGPLPVGGPSQGRSGFAHCRATTSNPLEFSACILGNGARTVGSVAAGAANAATGGVFTDLFSRGAVVMLGLLFVFGAFLTMRGGR